MSTILFELGCEELPPKSLKPLRDALQASVTEQLTEADITFDSIKAFAAPRRLAIQIQGISDKQPDRSEQKRGPAIKAAFDSDGNPTRASMGLAKWPTMPAARQRSRSSLKAWAVWAMIGKSGARALNCRVASYPSITGIWISISTTS